MGWGRVSVVGRDSGGRVGRRGSPCQVVGSHLEIRDECKGGLHCGESRPLAASQAGIEKQDPYLGLGFKTGKVHGNEAQVQETGVSFRMWNSRDFHFLQLNWGRGRGGYPVRKRRGLVGQT